MNDQEPDAPQAASTDAVARELELLAELCEIVVQRELELTELLQGARDFRCRYLAVVGAPQAELDRITARIAQLRSQLAPDDAALAAEAERAREDAEQAARAVRDAKRAAGPAAGGDDLDEESDDDGEADGRSPHRALVSAARRQLLRKLYRALARRVHPDLALDEEARAIRTDVMQDVIEAYEAGDLRRLQMMAEAYVERDGTGQRPSEVAPIRQRIVRMRLRLETLDIQIGEIQDDFLCHLERRVELAATEGVDVLAEMAAEVGARVVAARQELDGMDR